MAQNEKGTRGKGLIIDPYMNFRFRIVIEGIIEGGFNEISGLQETTQVEDFIEGGVNHFVRKLPKETTFENITLKKGLADAKTLWMWHKNVTAGRILRLPILIFLLKDRQQRDSAEIAHVWSYKEAFPIKWTGPDLKAEGSTVAFESLEIAHHGYADQ